MPGTETFAATALIAAAILSVWTLARPHKKPYAVGLLALICLLPGLALAGSAAWARPDLHLVALLLAAVALVPIWVIARGFGRVDLMAIVIHLGLGMKGSTLKDYETEIASALIVISVTVLAFWGLHNLLQTGPWLVWLGILTLVALNPLARQLVTRWLHPIAAADLSAALRPLAPAARPPMLPDLVVIYLEGMDRRFFDRSVFGELVAPLAALEAEGLSFDNVRQIAGTGSSLAGMVASLSGVPVLPKGLRGYNKLGGIEAFMPTIPSMGDVLAPHGYAMEYIVGADPRFAGIDVYFRTHGIDVIGRDEQIAMHPPDDAAAARIDRVLDDQMTCDSARLRQTALAAGVAPYLLVVETLGPHGRTGYLSRRATADGRGTKSRDARVVIRSLVDEAAALVADLRAEQARLRPQNPLRIALLSDHLSHNVNLPRGGADFAGRNTVILLGAAAGRVARQGAMIDVFATLLEWLGFLGPGAEANLGRSLLSPGPTLVEAHGVEMLDRLLTSDGALAARLWLDPPSSPD